MNMKCIIWIIFFVAPLIIALVCGGRRMLGKRSKHPKIENYLFKGSLTILAVWIFLYFIPWLISSVVFNHDLTYFAKIPGSDEQWFSFWASYSGAAATVIIAIFTYFNSKSIAEQEERFLRLLTGNNLRISKIDICRYQPISEREETCSYRVGLTFKNLSYSMIKNIEVKEFYIRFNGKDGIKDNNTDDYKKIEDVLSKPSFLLQGDTPYLTFDLIFRKDSEEGKKFTEFYYYDYLMGNQKLDIKIEIELCTFEGKKKKKAVLEITLLMTSRCEEEWGDILYSSEREFVLPVRKVLIYCYSVSYD